MRALSLFSGIGAMDLAAERAGIRVVHRVEKHHYRRQVLQCRWPGTPVTEDVRQFSGKGHGSIELVFGGPPCQPFTVFGKRLGVEDDRHLWPEMLRVVEESSTPWVVVENVANFANMVLDLVCDDLERMSYETQAYILPASAFGAPQLRQRVFVVAYSPEKRRAQLALNREIQVLRHTRETASSPRLSGVDQPDLGGAAHGTSAELDFPWPAKRGTHPGDSEPERTLPYRTPDGQDRLEALSEAVVPAQVYPIFQSIMDMRAWGLG